MPARSARKPVKSPNDPARDEYIDHVLQTTKTVADQNAILRARAPGRIKAAMTAARAAGLKNRATDNPLDHYHVVKRFLEERAFYPPHDKRKESTKYAAVHRQMTIVEDQPCLVCGVRHSTLGDKAKNPFGAVHMETHHHTIEWALANAIVPELFNAHVRPGLLRRAAQRNGSGKADKIYAEFDRLYGRDMSKAEITQWVDHSPDNLWVLCDVHHRHKFVGIHAITYPIWGPQDLVDATIVGKLIEAHGEQLKKNSGSAGKAGKSRPSARS